MDTASERGQILILGAFSLTVIASVLALSFSVSAAYDRRSALAAVADVAARSAAIEIHRGQPDPTILRRFAQNEVNLAISEGRLPAGTTALTPATAHTCDLSTTPCAYPTNRFYEVILEASSPGWFGFSALTPRARAVAGEGHSGDCMVITDPTHAADALDVGSGTTLAMPGCGIDDNGGIATNPTSVINAGDVSIRTGSCGTVPNCQTTTLPPSDPLQGQLTAPTAPGHTCSSPPLYTANTTISAGTPNQYYCGMTIDFGDTVTALTLSPGTYYIAGPIRPRTPGSKVTINGTGVMLYFAPGGSIQLDSNFVGMNLSAPTSGPYTGILFYQDPANSTDVILSKNNGDSINLSGAMYFPSASVTMKNGNGLTNDCSLLVARQIDIKNNTTMSNTCTAFGGSPILTVQVSE